jgi:hypothetical protein
MGNGVLSLQPDPTASALILAVSRGLAREILCLGPRGEGKTVSALLAMGAHASEHKKAGFPLPVPWCAITDTFNSHKEKTHVSLTKPFWQGAWRLEDGGHKAILNCNGDGVVLSLFGIEDSQAIDRARLETACVWVDEAAPTLEGAGVPELAFDVALTSQRVPTHAKVGLITSNYPEDTHWLWTRFQPIVGARGIGYHPEDRDRMWIQIFKGDSPHITKQDREEWARRLKDRPDLAGRLLEGRPGSVQLGQAVAEGFNEAAHVSRVRLYPRRGEPLFFGQDFGHTPATIIGQEWQGKVSVYAAIPCPFGGVRQHITANVKPWLVRHAPWVFQSTELIQGGYDQSGNTEEQADTDQSPILVLEELLPGFWEGGAVSWEGRKGPMLSLFNRAVVGEPALEIDPVDGLPLIRALRGGWYYPKDRLGNVSRDLPKKNHPHSDIGDAYCYFIGRIAPSQSKPTAVDWKPEDNYFDPLRPW